VSAGDVYAGPIVYKGAKSPETIQVTILRGDSGLDLSTVTAVTFVVRDERGGEVTWTAVIESKSWERLVAHHIFDTLGNETRAPGKYRLMPMLTVAGGVRRGNPLMLTIVP